MDDLQGKAGGWLADLKTLEAEAAQGNWTSLAELGSCYLTGDRGAAEDEARGIALIREAAEKGEAGAQFDMGLFSEKGFYGVEKDFPQSAEWYRKCAMQGAPDGLLKLGDCYRFGRGVTQDIALAIVCYRQAGERGSTVAKQTIFRLADNMATRPVLEQDSMRVAFSCKLPSIPGEKLNVAKNAL